MTREAKHHYLQEAKKAEDKAAKAVTGDLREQWLKIARGYRALAGQGDPISRRSEEIQGQGANG